MARAKDKHLGLMTTPRHLADFSKFQRQIHTGQQKRGPQGT